MLKTQKNQILYPHFRKPHFQNLQPFQGIVNGTSQNWQPFQGRRISRMPQTTKQPNNNHNRNHNNNNTYYYKLQLQLQLLHYTTLHPGVVSEVTTTTIATTPKSTTPTTFRSISGFALPSMQHHNNSPLL